MQADGKSLIADEASNGGKETAFNHVQQHKINPTMGFGKKALAHEQTGRLRPCFDTPSDQPTLLLRSEEKENHRPNSILQHQKPQRRIDWSVEPIEVGRSSSFRPLTTQMEETEMNGTMSTNDVSIGEDSNWAMMGQYCSPDVGTPWDGFHVPIASATNLTTTCNFFTPAGKLLDKAAFGNSTIDAKRISVVVSRSCTLDAEVNENDFFSAQKSLPKSNATSRYSFKSVSQDRHESDNGRMIDDDNDISIGTIDYHPSDGSLFRSMLNAPTMGTTPFNTFRHNSANIALHETQTYLERIKELEYQIADERGNREAELRKDFEQRIKTMVTEVRFADQTCLEECARSQNLELQLEAIRAENVQLRIDLEKAKATATCDLQNEGKMENLKISGANEKDSIALAPTSTVQEGFFCKNCEVIQGRLSLLKIQIMEQLNSFLASRIELGQDGVSKKDRQSEIQQDLESVEHVLNQFIEQTEMGKSQAEIVTQLTTQLKSKDSLVNRIQGEQSFTKCQNAKRNGIGILWPPEQKLEVKDGRLSRLGATASEKRLMPSTSCPRETQKSSPQSNPPFESFSTPRKLDLSRNALALNEKTEREKRLLTQVMKNSLQAFTENFSDLDGRVERQISNYNLRLRKLSETILLLKNSIHFEGESEVLHSLQDKSNVSINTQASNHISDRNLIARDPIEISEYKHLDNCQTTGFVAGRNCEANVSGSSLDHYVPAVVAVHDNKRMRRTADKSDKSTCHSQAEKSMSFPDGMSVLSDSVVSMKESHSDCADFMQWFARSPLPEARQQSSLSPTWAEHILKASFMADDSNRSKSPEISQVQNIPREALGGDELTMSRMIERHVIDCTELRSVATEADPSSFNETSGNHSKKEIVTTQEQSRIKLDEQFKSLQEELVANCQQLSKTTLCVEEINRANIRLMTSMHFLQKRSSLEGKPFAKEPGDAKEIQASAASDSKILQRQLGSPRSITELEKKLSEARVQNVTASKERLELLQQIEELGKQIESSSTENESLQTRLQEMIEERLEMEQCREEIETNLRQVQNTVMSAAQFQPNELNDRIKSLCEENVELTALVLEKEERIRSLSIELDECTTRLAAKEADVSHMVNVYETEISRLCTSNAGFKDKCGRLRDYAKKLTAKCDRWQNFYEAIQVKYETARQKSNILSEFYQQRSQVSVSVRHCDAKPTHPS